MFGRGCGKDPAYDDVLVSVGAVVSAARQLCVGSTFQALQGPGRTLAKEAEPPRRETRRCPRATTSSGLSGEKKWKTLVEHRGDASVRVYGRLARQRFA
ncbi:hypothetical protein NDN08_002186 [Rhodosorus marinus]|uniref:Uncharacterized protein n=1 Tax=Rhodosorus marinus TaxID=101924 RepID=A0AAV8UYT2_9RHOD|nr:hypothetical protein NDN08_002186 [Rhodosorus marinus]